MKLIMWRVVVDVNMHTKFRIREKNSLLPTWYVGKMKQTIFLETSCAY